ncbi:MAG: hypothetical protein WA705_24735 [Candidatus Ozemobacteraceae bacterium]
MAQTGSPPTSRREFVFLYDIRMGNPDRNPRRRKHTFNTRSDAYFID